MRLLEPFTTLTDYALALEAFVLAICLMAEAVREDRPRSAAKLSWSGAFLTIWLAASLGGSLHGFRTAFDPFAEMFLSRLIVQILGVGSFFVLVGAISTSVERRWQFPLIILASLKLLACVAWTTLEFDPGLDYAFSDFAITAAIAIWLQLRNRTPAGSYVIWGLAVAMAGALLWRSDLDTLRNFGNGLFHVILMLSIWLLYQGGLKLEDATS